MASIARLMAAAFLHGAVGQPFAQRFDKNPKAAPVWQAFAPSTNTIASPAGGAGELDGNTIVYAERPKTAPKRRPPSAGTWSGRIPIPVRSFSARSNMRTPATLAGARRVHLARARLSTSGRNASLRGLDKARHRRCALSGRSA